MSDLVERLEKALFYQDDDGFLFSLIEECKDEIQRLTQELAESREIHGKHKQWIINLQDEIARLTQELEQYQWVSVEERLPESRCLIFTPSQPDEKGQYRIVASDLIKTVSDATHWMPLPTSPEGE